MINKALAKEDLFEIIDKRLPGSISSDSESKNSGRRIYFERITMDGAKEMHRYSTNDKFFRYLASNTSRTIDDTKQYLSNLISEVGTEAIDRKRMVWFVKRLDCRKIIGTASLLNIDYQSQSVEWSYGIDPELWGEGYVFEIQNILKEYVFIHLKLNRLYGSARLDNELTVQTLKKSGMKEEGIMRQARRDSKGTYHDYWCYGLLSEEYFSKLNRQEQPKTFSNKRGAKLYYQIQNLLKLDSLPSDNLVLRDLALWDSLKQMELVAILEDNLAVELTIDEIICMKTVGDIMDIVSARNNAQQTK